VWDDHFAGGGEACSRARPYLTLFPPPYRISSYCVSFQFLSSSLVALPSQFWLFVSDFFDGWLIVVRSSGAGLIVYRPRLNSTR
jgi:hypothetical protein